MKVKRGLLITGIIIGSLLTMAPLFGMLGTAIGMGHAFNTLGDSGIADPRALSKSIGMTLFSTAAGLLLFPVGVVVLTLSLTFFLRLPTSTPPPLPHRRPDEV